MLHIHLPFITHADDALMNLLRYLALCITDGDWLNDWLTHLPEVIRPHVEVLGAWLSVLFKVAL